jgi:hypothetical protein
MKKLRTETRAKAARAARRRKPEDLSEEEQVLRAATLHLMMKHGSLLVATGARATTIKGHKVWILTVTLRYDPGDECHVGDLLYDGEQFTFLTEQVVMDERVRQFAEDPERLRRWNEYRASTLRSGEA